MVRSGHLSPAAQATVVGARLFAEKGYSATTTRELSRALGVTNGTFYHHFPTKEDLLVRICRESLDRITQASIDALASVETKSPRAKLEAMIVSHTTTMLADQPLHTTMLTELRSLNAANRASVTEARERYASFLREQIEECQRAGDVRTDIDARLLTLLLLNILNWTIFWFDPEGALTSAELAHKVVTTFLDGAGA